MSQQAVAAVEQQVRDKIWIYVDSQVEIQIYNHVVNQVWRYVWGRVWRPARTWVCEQAAEDTDGSKNGSWAGL